MAAKDLPTSEVFYRNVRTCWMDKLSRPEHQSGFYNYFTKQHIKDIGLNNERWLMKMILWCDARKCNSLSRSTSTMSSPAHHLDNTIPRVKRGGSIYAMWVHLSSRYRETVSNWRNNKCQTKRVLKENLIQSSCNPYLGWYCVTYSTAHCIYFIIIIIYDFTVDAIVHFPFRWLWITLEIALQLATVCLCVLYRHTLYAQ